MMLFIDKYIVARLPKGLCLFIGIVCLFLSFIFRPYAVTAQYVEGIISEYNVDIIQNAIGKGGGILHCEFYYIIIDNIKILLSDESEKFEGRKTYWKGKLEGKYAKVIYLQKSNPVIHDIELEDGSYSFHSPKDISSYHVRWFPFCITAPIALFCIFVILRFFYLLIFASDERRELVFGNKDYNPF